MVSITADGPIWTLDLGEDENRFSPDRLTEIESALDELLSVENLLRPKYRDSRYYSGADPSVVEIPDEQEG